jgi:diadenosine tetraphosphatase ApaH/serine/threonine PP2A family protein phosphatase
VQDLTLEQTLAATSIGGQYEGWQIAHNTQAQLFSDALLVGLSNACTITDAETCNMLLPNDLTSLLGDMHGSLSEEVGFLSDGGPDGQAGYMEYVHEGDFGSLYKSNEGDTTDRAGWLLYRIGGTGNPSPTDVPEPSTLALFCLGVVGIVARARRRAPQSVS